jgi:molybdopterin synthase sulfur carrier subunit
MIRIILPAHLQSLANLPREIQLTQPRGTLTQRSLLEALESQYPALCGTIRDHVTRERRPLVRFFACEEDLSHESPEAPLPEKVANGTEPFIILGAIAGG